MRILQILDFKEGIKDSALQSDIRHYRCLLVQNSKERLSLLINSSPLTLRVFGFNPIIYGYIQLFCAVTRLPELPCRIL